MPQIKEGAFKVKLESIDVSGCTRVDFGDLIALSRSIDKIGLVNPLVVDKEMRLIAGFRRLEALKLLKRDECEARFYDTLTPYERRRIEIEEGIIHKKALLWPEEVKLKEELHALYLDEHKHEKVQAHNKKPWTQQDTADVIGIAKTSMSEDLRLAEALSVFPELANVGSKKDALRKMYRLREIALLKELARRGGGFTNDDVKILHEDALEVLANLPDACVDLVITDPPWGIDFVENRQGSRATLNYDDCAEESIDLYAGALPDLYRVLKDGCHMYLFFGIQHYQRISDLLLEAGFDARHMPCMWIKEAPGYTDWEYKPMLQYECFFYCVKPGTDGAVRRLNEATSDVFMYPRAKGKIHASEKPVDLMKRLMRLSSNEGDLVLDPFAGSCSVAKASYVMKRRCLCVEIDKEIYDMGLGSFNNFVISATETVVETTD